VFIDILHCDVCLSDLRKVLNDWGKAQFRLIDRRLR